MNDELTNVYFDQANTFKKTIPSATFTAIKVSTITAVSSATITNLTVTNFSGTLTGTTTNDDAATGKVGEYISATAGSTNLVTALAGQDIASISLTAGDWNVTGIVKFSINSATWSSNLLYIANESGNSFTNASELNSFQDAWNNSATTPTQNVITVANVRVSIASPTTIYLKARANWSAGTPQAEGSITARRVR